MVSGTANRNFEMLWNLPNSYSKVSFSIPLKSKSVKKMSPFSLWYLVLQIDFLKCYGTSLILLKNQLQYSTEMEKRKENWLKWTRIPKHKENRPPQVKLIFILTILHQVFALYLYEEFTMGIWFTVNKMDSSIFSKFIVRPIIRFDT